MLWFLFLTAHVNTKSGVDLNLAPSVSFSPITISANAFNQFYIRM
jgi:hypothetical protein